MDALEQIDRIEIEHGGKGADALKNRFRLNLGDGPFPKRHAGESFTGERQHDRGKVTAGDLKASFQEAREDRLAVAAASIQDMASRRQPRQPVIEGIPEAVDY